MTVVGFKSRCTLSDNMYVNVVLQHLICSCSLRLSCVAEPSSKILNYEFVAHAWADIVIFEQEAEKWSSMKERNVYLKDSWSIKVALVPRTKFGMDEDQNLGALNNPKLFGRVKWNLQFVAETHLSSKCSLQRGSNNPLDGKCKYKTNHKPQLLFTLLQCKRCILCEIWIAWMLGQTYPDKLFVNKLLTSCAVILQSSPYNPTATRTNFCSERTRWRERSNKDRELYMKSG